MGRQFAHGPYRYGAFHDGPDPLAEPLDAGTGIDELARRILGGQSVREALRDLLRRGMRGRRGLSELARDVDRRRRDLENGGMSGAVVRSITEIAHLLGKQAVAEQVETAEQLELLRQIGVDFGQGYVFQRPRPIDAFFGLDATGEA